jgi:hypothetical protein
MNSKKVAIALFIFGLLTGCLGFLQPKKPSEYMDGVIAINVIVSIFTIVIVCCQHDEPEREYFGGFVIAIFTNAALLTFSASGNNFFGVVWYGAFLAYCIFLLLTEKVNIHKKINQNTASFEIVEIEYDDKNLPTKR